MIEPCEVDKKSDFKLLSFLKSFVAFQGELKPAVKDSYNPHYKSSYADLAKCVETAQPILLKHNFCIVQKTRLEHIEGKTRTILQTELWHIDGHSIASEMLLNPLRDDAQGVGATITYYRRFGYCTILGLAVEDDDGNTASNVKTQSAPVYNTQKTQTQQAPQKTHPQQVGNFTPPPPLPKELLSTGVLKDSQIYDYHNIAHKKFLETLAQKADFQGELRVLAKDFHGKINIAGIRENESLKPKKSQESFEEGVTEL